MRFWVGMVVNNVTLSLAGNGQTGLTVFRTGMAGKDNGELCQRIKRITQAHREQNGAGMKEGEESPVVMATVMFRRNPPTGHSHWQRNGAKTQPEGECSVENVL